LTSKINWKTVKRKIHFVCKKTEKFSFFVFFQFYFSENINISEKKLLFLLNIRCCAVFQLCAVNFHEEKAWGKFVRIMWESEMEIYSLTKPNAFSNVYFFPYGWNFGRLFFINCLLHVFLVFPFVSFSYTVPRPWWYKIFNNINKILIKNLSLIKKPSSVLKKISNFLYQLDTEYD
jgi:hypothetical protein